ncbi:MAG: hypothetical protein CM1200mP35_05030 [Chloroflexota bacterium]|nr:MAG: hypothetical protein CM1200mP35_05030 [Chloroflexota bacterium]
MVFLFPQYLTVIYWLGESDLRFEPIFENP